MKKIIILLILTFGINIGYSNYEENINDKYVEVNNIEKYGFSIENKIDYNNGEIIKYFLKSKSNKTKIRIGETIYIGNINKQLNNNIKKSYIGGLWHVHHTKDEKEIYKNIKIGGKIYNVEIYTNKKTKDIKLTFFYNSVNFVIEGNLSNIKEIKKAFKLFLNMKIKTKKNIVKDNGFLGLVNDGKNKVYLEKFISMEGKIFINGVLFPENGNYIHLNVNIYEENKKNKYLSLTDIVNNYKKLNKDLKIVQNNNGNFFLYYKYENYYSFILFEEKDNKYKTYSFNFYTMSKQDKYVEDKIFRFIHNTFFDGKFVNNFDISSARVYQLYEVLKRELKKDKKLLIKNYTSSNFLNFDLVGKDSIDFNNMYDFESNDLAFTNTLIYEVFIDNKNMGNIIMAMGSGYTIQKRYIDKINKGNHSLFIKNTETGEKSNTIQINLNK